MTWIFSKRCRQSLTDEKIKVSIPVSVRVRILKSLQKYNSTWMESTNSGFNYDTSTFQKLRETIEYELGLTELLAFPEEGGKPIAGDLDDFVLRGMYPPNIFDTLEVFYTLIDQTNDFQKDINDIMEESKLPWRMANGKIFPVNSSYIEEEILRRASELVNEAGFSGCLMEFEKARTDLTTGDYEGAIQNANLAIESMCKEVTGIKRAKPGELYRALIDKGIIPEYYDGFLKAFEENILRAPAIMRNQELGVGHGRGSSTTSVPKELAELAIHLSAVMINYIIKKSLEMPFTIEDDLPFKE